jgi:type VI secretion system secreted protein Hcp
MKTKLLFACTLALGLTASTTADAALNAYLKLKGNKQGDIRGGVTQKGREGKIMVIAVDHQIKSPTVGKVGHGAFVVTKELDRSTPLLLKAATTGETFDFELQFWTPQLSGATGGGGAEKQHYTVKLTGARIVDHEFKLLNNKNPELTRYAEQEVISFVYETVEWIWVDGPIKASASQ